MDPETIHANVNPQIQQQLGFVFGAIASGFEMVLPCTAAELPWSAVGVFLVQRYRQATVEFRAVWRCAPRMMSPAGSATRSSEPIREQFSADDQSGSFAWVPAEERPYQIAIGGQPFTGDPRSNFRIALVEVLAVPALDGVQRHTARVDHA